MKAEVGCDKVSERVSQLPSPRREGCCNALKSHEVHGDVGEMIPGKVEFLLTMYLALAHCKKWRLNEPGGGRRCLSLVAASVPRGERANHCLLDRSDSVKVPGRVRRAPMPLTSRPTHQRDARCTRTGSERLQYHFRSPWTGQTMREEVEVLRCSLVGP